LVESHGQHVSRAVASREAAKSIVTLAMTGMSTEGTGQSIFATMSDTICGQPAASSGKHIGTIKLLLVVFA